MPKHAANNKSYTNVVVITVLHFILAVHTPQSDVIDKDVTFREQYPDVQSVTQKYQFAAGVLTTASQ